MPADVAICEVQDQLKMLLLKGCPLCVVKQGLALWDRVAGQRALRRDSCIHLLSAGIRSMGHNAQIFNMITRDQIQLCTRVQ